MSRIETEHPVAGFKITDVGLFPWKLCKVSYLWREEEIIAYIVKARERYNLRTEACRKMGKIPQSLAAEAA